MIQDTESVWVKSGQGNLWSIIYLLIFLPNSQPRGLVIFQFLTMWRFSILLMHFLIYYPWTVYSDSGQILNVLFIANKREKSNHASDSLRRFSDPLKNRAKTRVRAREEAARCDRKHFVDRGLFRDYLGCTVAKTTAIRKDEVTKHSAVMFL